MAEEEQTVGTKAGAETAPTPAPETEQEDGAQEGVGDEVKGGSGADKDVEARARRMGWVPEDEYKGRGLWRGAEEFVERGEQEMPILRERLRRQDGQLAEMQQTLDDLKGYIGKAQATGYKRALADLKEKQLDAVAKGDRKLYDKVDQKIGELQQDFTPEPARQPAGQDAPPEIKEWTARNPWLVSDPVLNVYAQEVHTRLGQAQPGLSLAENLERVTEEVKRRFPEKFGIGPRNPRRGAAASVEGGGTQRKRGGGGKTYADLPADAKGVCDRFVKQGVLTAEQYVKDYDFSEA